MLIVEWRRHSYKWTARIIYSLDIDGSEGPAVVDRWVPAESLRPARTDPNTAFGLR
ncbi:hypothetical protein [Sinomonas terrae]|uniref:Uncharacterized protein n=1 Tax=Sinomonas terrae TaxID=2908838 RepID=A0ABS9U7U4_9MICC|nr:hypothetical protein [Sinomonas terrae]MCH6472437.1 hypothetical protein [Sinomonas terrae]